MIKKDIIILTIASNSDFYNQIVKNYWIPFINYTEKNFNNVKVFLVYGNSYDEKIGIPKENVLFFNEIQETLKPGILLKTLKGFEFLQKNFDYQFLFRTNLSSFIIIDNFLKKINNFQFQPLVYAGVLGQFGDKYFVSGAGILFNKRLIDFLIENQEFLKTDILDDLSFGKLLSKIEKTKLKRLDILNGCLPEDLKNHFHLRIKGPQKTQDINLFKTLTEKIYL